MGYTQEIQRMKTGIWMNRRSGNLRLGSWEYYWPGDFFRVWINGVPFQRVLNESPEFGDWVHIGDL